MRPLPKRLVSTTALTGPLFFLIHFLTDRFHFGGYFPQDFVRLLVSVALSDSIDDGPCPFLLLFQALILLRADHDRKRPPLLLYDHWLLGIVHKAQEVAKVG